ncbi:tRNA synthetases class II core domain (F) [seawater metagenome]|uniref:tRNA synthetases class II core domain (F) n=1 Tax=seawater metagenome TaxID=1561972 RepID=A0A5E8CJP2_9ZZZZ
MNLLIENYKKRFINDILEIIKKEDFYTDFKRVHYINESNLNNKIIRSELTLELIDYIKKLKLGNDSLISMVGKVKREDEIDNIHLSVFHQLEFIMIKEDIDIYNMIDKIKNILEKSIEKQIIIKDIKKGFEYSLLENHNTVDFLVKLNDGTLSELGALSIIDNNIINCPQSKVVVFGFGIERLIQAKYNISNIIKLDPNYIERFDSIDSIDSNNKIQMNIILDKKRENDFLQILSDTNIRSRILNVKKEENRLIIDLHPSVALEKILEIERVLKKQQ